MSIHISSAVWAHSRAEGTTLLVLIALADQANDDGYCWPGVKRLALRCRVSTRTVQRALTELEEIGELNRTYRYTEVQKQTSSQYRVSITQGDKLTPLPEMSPMGDTGVMDEGDTGVTERVTQVSPKSSIEPSVRTVRESTRATEPDPGGAEAGFEEFWKAYPRKADKGHARKAWKAAARKTDPGTVVAAATAFGDLWATRDKAERRFIPLPATWLNGERWDDDDGSLSDQQQQLPIQVPRFTMPTPPPEYDDDPAGALAFQERARAEFYVSYGAEPPEKAKKYLPDWRERLNAINRALPA